MNRTSALLIAALLSAPSAGFGMAATCTDRYYVCLNDSYDTSGILRVLADAGCLASYYACLKTALK